MSFTITAKKAVSNKTQIIWHNGKRGEEAAFSTAP
jgi:hypothetical protein